DPAPNCPWLLAPAGGWPKAERLCSVWRPPSAGAVGLRRAAPPAALDEPSDEVTVPSVSCGSENQGNPEDAALEQAVPAMPAAWQEAGNKAWYEAPTLAPPRPGTSGGGGGQRTRGSWRLQGYGLKAHCLAEGERAKEVVNFENELNVLVQQKLQARGLERLPSRSSPKASHQTGMSSSLSRSASDPGLALDVSGGLSPLRKGSLPKERCLASP
ncbi:unnamed protein product, partial [Polarella glacialis]